PPAYFTTDWQEARRSVERLAALEPEIAATGHGNPMRGEILRHQLAWLASNFRAVVPSQGRYVREPALSDERGLKFVPPPINDPLPRTLGLVGAAFCIGMIYGKIRRKRKSAS